MARRLKVFIFYATYIRRGAIMLMSTNAKFPDGCFVVVLAHSRKEAETLLLERAEKEERWRDLDVIAEAIRRQRKKAPGPKTYLDKAEIEDFRVLEFDISGPKVLLPASKK